MEGNKKILLFGMVIIAAVLSTSVWLVTAFRLDQPVFLRYCVEVSAVPARTNIYDERLMELKYITNYDDTRKVTGIVFQEAEEIGLFATEDLLYKKNVFPQPVTQRSSGEDIGRYCIRIVYVYSVDHYLEDWEGELELHTALITLSDGSTFTVDLGKVLLYSDRAGSDAITMEYASASNTDSSSNGYLIQKNLTVNTIESKLLTEAAPFLGLRINDTNFLDFSPIRLQKGDKLRVDCGFADTEGFVDAYDEYELRPKLSYTAEDGSTGAIRVYNITKHKYFFSFWEVFDYLRNVREVW